jgi:peptidoglycan/LPS O-acetylase OafA/YrhL
MLALRILTIIFSFAGLLCGGILVGAGALDEPAPDTGAIWLGAGILLYFIANLYLLYRSYKKKHRPTHWVAFILALLPTLLILGLLVIANVADELF